MQRLGYIYHKLLCTGYQLQADSTPANCGRLAQLVERTLCMREVGGSKPPMSNFLHVFLIYLSIPAGIYFYLHAYFQILFCGFS
jgi:hypothetical protein